MPSVARGMPSGEPSTRLKLGRAASHELRMRSEVCPTPSQELSMGLKLG
jgi:hypothetical protein